MGVSLAGHVRQRNTEREQLNWMNQIELACDCSGSTDDKPCEWRKAGKVWEHITAPLPSTPFRRK